MEGTNSPEQLGAQAPIQTPDAPATPQSQDKTDAMTYPLGSQADQSASQLAAAQEDHRTILERISGLFGGNKDKAPEAPAAPQAPTHQAHFPSEDAIDNDKSIPPPPYSNPRS